MPEKETLERAREAKREGKRPTTQAGEFIRARQAKQAARRRGPAEAAARKAAATRRAA